MLSHSDRAIEPVVDFFTEVGIEIGLLVPTDTGLKKGILDATENVRAMLMATGFHDYEEQGQGGDHKRKEDAIVFTAAGAHPTKVSLYRPVTKKGDPRIWFYGLDKLVDPWNLLVAFVHRGKVVLVNASDSSLWSQIQNETGECWKVIQEASSQLTDVETELLGKLYDISDGGWHRNVGAGPKAVGETLEALLGIPPNPSKGPDYKGIELKSKRRRRGGNAGSLQTIFSKVPDWNRSKIKHAREFFEFEDILDRNEDGRRQLYCTISALAPNTKDLLLDVQNEQSDLWCSRVVEQGNDRLLYWDVDVLRQSLRKKHKTTMWIAAERRGRGEREEFFYYQADLTRGPLESQLGLRLEDGTITLDLTLSEKPNGRVRDHGYLFRCSPRNLERLFPQPRVFDLTAPPC